MAASWLLDLTVAGQVLRYATEAAVVAGDVYEPGLSDLTVELGAVSVGIEVIGAPPPGGWAVVASRWPLEGAPARLRWWDGTSDPIVVVDGVLVGAEWGEEDEPLSGSVDAIELVAGGLVPPPTHVVDQTTWATTWAAGTTPAESLGRAYPLVLGNPGATEASAIPVVPAVLASNPLAPGAQFVVASGRVAAGAVRFQAVAATYVTESVVTTDGTDAAGIQYVGVSEADLPTITVPGTGPVDAEYYTGWSRAGGGGLRRLDARGALQGVGEVMRRILTDYSTVPIDIDRWRQHEPWLNQYRVDTWIDEPTDAWEWVSSALLPMVPVHVLRGGRGIWLAPIRWGATARDAVARLAQHRDVVRVGGVATRSQPFNAFSLEYAYGRGKYYRTRTLTAESGRLASGPALPDDRVHGDLLCRDSQARYGLRVHDPIQAPHTWDDATALRILRDRALELALPHRVVRYVGGLGLARLAPGDVVILDDPAVAIDDAPALVDRVELSVDEVRLDLVVLSRAAEAPAVPAWSSTYAYGFERADTTGFGVQSQAMATIPTSGTLLAVCEITWSSGGRQAVVSLGYDGSSGGIALCTVSSPEMGVIWVDAGGTPRNLDLTHGSIPTGKFVIGITWTPSAVGVVLAQGGSALSGGIGSAALAGPDAVAGPAEVWGAASSGTVGWAVLDEVLSQSEIESCAETYDGPAQLALSRGTLLASCRAEAPGALTNAGYNLAGGQEPLIPVRAMGPLIDGPWETTSAATATPVLAV